MADNDTQVRASTQNNDGKTQPVMIYITCAVTTVTLIYGVISWCIIKQFRNYRNFVFLNVIFTNLLLVLIIMFCRYVLYTPLINTQTLAYQQFSVLTYFLYLYLATVKVHWLIVVCHMFYVDIVKVFNGHIQRRHFKSCLFAWGMPFVTSMVYTYVTTAAFNLKQESFIHNISYFYFVLPLLLNSSLYIVIVCTLFRSSNVSSNTASSKWRHLYIATLIFLLSDCLIFPTQFLVFFDTTATTMLLDQLIVEIINPLLIYVYFVVVKRNRVLWYEFYVNKLNKRQRNRDIKMAVKNVRPTTDRQRQL